MYHSFLIFGTFWFWFMVVIGWIAITAILEVHTELDRHPDEGGGSWATAVVILGVAAYFFLGSDVHVKTTFNFLMDNPLITVGGVLAYFLTGILWAFAKWHFFLNRIREEFDEDCKNGREYKIKDFEIPKAGDYKNRITTWISYWPISMSWTVLDDPLKKIAHNIYLKCGKIFDSMSVNKFKDVEQRKQEVLAKKEKEEAERKRLAEERLNQHKSNK
jgi:hypothetical protein